ncbi:MAG TPA: hypothetical protein VGH74_02055, partial [Planctomycetaceae bacterium]
MKVLHLSTWRQRCGIADFAESIVTHLARQGVESEVFPLSTPALKYATSAELRNDYDRALRMAGDFDLVHIQHEFGFFAGDGGLFEAIENFGYVLSGLKRANRPTAVTFHGEPAFAGLVPAAPTEGSGSAAALRVLVGKFRTRRVVRKLERLWQRQVVPFFDGSPGSFRVLVHTPRTRLAVIRSG